MRGGYLWPLTTEEREELIEVSRIFGTTTAEDRKKYRQEEERRLKKEKEEQIRERVVRFKEIGYMNYMDLARYMDLPQGLINRWVNKRVDHRGYTTSLRTWFAEYVYSDSCKHYSYDDMLSAITSFLDGVEAKNR